VTSIRVPLADGRAFDDRLSPVERAIADLAEEPLAVAGGGDHHLWLGQSASECE
jgi:hypothetical protein